MLSWLRQVQISDEDIELLRQVLPEVKELVVLQKPGLSVDQGRF